MEILVFFDESGRKTDKPLLMGALAIPKTIYTRSEFTDMNGAKIHWNQYAGYEPSREEIIKAVALLKGKENLIRMNVINYDQSLLEKNAHFYPNKGLSSRTIYTKFPELLIDQLNIQSLYRGENFRILDSRLEDKGVEIGLELTDLLLGLIRTIIKNPAADTSSREKAKITLVLDLLQDPHFYALLRTRLRYYEWTSAHELTEVDFNNYLQAFLSQHHTRWLQPPFFVHNG